MGKAPTLISGLTNFSFLSSNNT